MKYCFNYNKSTEKMKYIKNAQEWTIKYNSKDSTLLTFLDRNKDKRINLYFEDVVTIDFLYELNKKYDNLYFKLKKEQYYNKDLKYNFKFFFDEPVGDWDTLIGLLEYGVSDVYIVEDLGFELDRVKTIAAQYNVQIRVFPNVAQSKFLDTNSLKKFFIRPEDIKKYENYIDVIEFYHSDEQLDTYYEIYAIDRKWFGKLNEIIKDFDLEIDNKYIISNFSEKRIKCGKKCLKGGTCKRCDNISHLADSLEQSKLIVWDNE